MAKLTIVFGGLCMFVEKRRGDNQGLYVLMPRMDHEPQHCPMVLAPSDNPAMVWAWSFSGFAESLGTTPSTPVPLDSTHFLRMSRYAGAAVAPSHFAGRPSGCLVARVKLPLDTAVTPIPPFGRVRVPDNSVVSVTGLASVEIDVPPNVEIGGYPARQWADGPWQVALVNIPRAHLDGKFRETRVNTPLGHVSAYYGLLQGRCSDHPHGPEIYPDEDYTPDDDPAGEQPCDHYPKPTEVQGVLPGTGTMIRSAARAMAGIDPVNCTIGTGCEDLGTC